MSNISEKIQSLGETVGASYRRPSTEHMDKMQMLLWGNDTALEYLRVQRNLTDETIKHFGLGYDQDKHAIAIPYFKRGELINIKYRFIDPKDIKYVQERKTELWLFNDAGLELGRTKHGILIVEGEFDAMSAYQAGFQNVISPGSGKDSYGVWLEMIDNIPKVYIAYDNDKPGRDAALKFAERVGFEKCFEVMYPSETKDANDYFKKYDPSQYRELIKSARPFYKHQFKGLVDIIQEMRSDKTEKLTLESVPDVQFGKDWIVVISGKSNVGKTSYAMNIVNELVDKNISVLVLPFERGPQVVGTRFLQARHAMSEGELVNLEDKGWETIIQDSLDVPLYFAMPSRNDTLETIIRSKRIFNTKVVIIDHLDYMIRNSQHKEQEIGSTLQEMKRVAEENEILLFVVTHIRKIDTPGAKRAKKPSMEDLKGSAALYQDPECVIMLTSDSEESMSVDVVKNKGKMSRRLYSFNRETGKIGPYDYEEDTPVDNLEEFFRKR